MACRRRDPRLRFTQAQSAHAFVTRADFGTDWVAAAAAMLLKWIAMEDHRWIAVSPRHRVRLAGEYLLLLDRAPRRDFVVHTIEKREANGLPLMSADIVIAGAPTRQQYPLAATYPLHFRKTYFAARLHADPRIEYERSLQAGELLGLPPPIGYTGDVFRTCLIPGSPYRRLTPFAEDAEESNLWRARDLTLASAAGLWRLAEEACRQLSTLHASGLAHGDAELQNFIVCPAPLELVTIDFEAAVQRDAFDDAGWQTRCALDYAPLLKEAIFLQAALGRQRGDLADKAWAACPQLFRDPERVSRAVEQLGELNPGR
jgi:hypothetical protein